MNGLNKRQREWAKRAYAQDGEVVCHFPVYSEDCGWGICGSDRSIQIHHIVPKRLFSFIFGTNPNVPLNLVPLCAYHHIGKRYMGSLNWREDVVPVVHPDIAWALRNYADSKGASFDEVFEGREDRVKRGLTYHNFDWDGALKEIAETIVWRYIVENPDDPFPD
jgi:hypothetical protein